MSMTLSQGRSPPAIGQPRTSLDSHEGVRVLTMTLTVLSHSVSAIRRFLAADQSGLTSTSLRTLKGIVQTTASPLNSRPLAVTTRIFSLVWSIDTTGELSAN